MIWVRALRRLRVRLLFVYNAKKAEAVLAAQVNPFVEKAFSEIRSV